MTISIVVIYGTMGDFNHYMTDIMPDIKSNVIFESRCIIKQLLQNAVYIDRCSDRKLYLYEDWTHKTADNTGQWQLCKYEDTIRYIWAKQTDGYSQVS